MTEAQNNQHQSPAADNDLYRLLFEEATDSMFLTDPQGRLIAVNARAAELNQQRTFR